MRARHAARLHDRANALANSTADAYSVDRYYSWFAVARALLSAGYSDREAEAIMRSKYTRWAADCTAAPNRPQPSRVLLDYLQKNMTARQLAELVTETFA